MSFKTEIEINPHPDGVHCGECVFYTMADNEYQFDGFCEAFRKIVCEGDFGENPERCSKCIEAEKKAKGKHKTKCGNSCGAFLGDGCDIYPDKKVDWETVACDDYEFVD